MPRKLKKGYFVKGQFVAEGSALDLEYKRELKGTDAATRTDQKRASAELQKLGEDLLTLRADALERLQLGDKLNEALAEAKRITNFEGRRRQLQFIGKLMRLLTPDTLEAARAALVEQHLPSAQETLLLHQCELWRQRLLSEEDAMGPWLQLYPGSDSQQLRALLRQARKDAVPELPGAAPRHGRAYREIFQLLREQMLAPLVPEPGAERGYSGQDA